MERDGDHQRKSSKARVQFWKLAQMSATKLLHLPKYQTDPWPGFDPSVKLRVPADKQDQFQLNYLLWLDALQIE